MYKWVDDEGNIQYSDKPQHKDAQPFTPPGLTTTPAVKVPPKPVKKTTPEPAPTAYSDLKIVSPQQDATIRSNPGNVTVEFQLVPALNTELGHSVSVLLDGTPARDNITTNRVQLTNVDRGTHNITILVKDNKGRTLRSSDSVTIHLHRVSILHKKQPIIPPPAPK